MNHNQFIETYLRTAQNTDWAFWVQCVDLAKLYSREVLGIELGSFGGSARNGWLNKAKTFDLKKWVKVLNSPAAIPPRGAIIFYDEPWLTGHVAIVHEADVNDVLLIEQNWATGNWDWKGYNAINFEAKRDYKKVSLMVYKKIIWKY